MISTSQSDTTLIDCVRMQATSAEAVAARQNLETLLRGATLRVSRLPSAAILIVRRLQHRAPGVSLAHLNQVQVTAWEHSLNAELDRLAAEAGRPALGTAPPGAQAVCFANRAEMLACLASDWLRGILASHWWWRTLLRRHDAETVIGREWTGSPEFVPLALEYLAQSSQAIPFAQRIRDELAAALLARIRQAFAVSSPSAPEAYENTCSTPPSNFTAQQPVSPPAPWSCVAPEADAPELQPGKQVFLAQALMLWRAPAVARRADFQRRIVHWQLAVAADRSRTQSPTDGIAPPPAHPSDSLTAHRSAERNSPTEGDGRVSADTDAAAYNVRVPSLRDSSRAEDDHGVERRLDEHHQPPATAGPAADAGLRGLSALSSAPMRAPERLHTESRVAAHPENRDSAVLNVTESASASTQSSPAIALAAQQRLHSAFAGVFFLINVVQALGLYSDFSAPQGGNLELNIWDFLALLGRLLVGEVIYADGLNFALATLAGRSLDEPPGKHFEPPPNWQLPPAWLDAFPEFFEWKESVLDGRVQVEHPAGFWLKDEAMPARDNTAASLERWTNCMAAYVRARLVRALARDNAAEFLCRVPGTIEIGPMHVDVHYSLQSYPAEIRLAGLDRDPGWVPAAGRYVAYHFD